MLNGKELGAAIGVAIDRKLEAGLAPSKAAIARHFGIKPPSLFDWVKKGSVDKGKLEELFRYFSDVCKPSHWGLTDDSFLISSSKHSNEAVEQSLVGYSLEKKQKGLHTIAQYNDVRGAMGVGVILQDQPGQITSWEVTAEWIDKNIPANTGAKNLRIITGFGDSMKGVFNPGDPILIDIGVRTCDHDGLYFFRVGNEGFIKRLQRIPGQGILVISKNTDYVPWTITQDMDFEVLAKILVGWKSEIF